MGGIISWIVAHQVILVGFVVAFLDFIFGINKNWESNGILHAIYVFFKGLVKPEIT